MNAKNICNYARPILAGIGAFFALGSAVRFVSYAQPEPENKELIEQIIPLEKEASYLEKFVRHAAKKAKYRESSWYPGLQRDYAELSGKVNLMKRQPYVEQALEEYQTQRNNLAGGVRLAEMSTVAFLLAYVCKIKAKQKIEQKP